MDPSFVERQTIICLYKSLWYYAHKIIFKSHMFMYKTIVLQKYIYPIKKKIVYIKTNCVSEYYEIIHFKLLCLFFSLH